MVGDNIEVQTNISFLDAAKGVKKDIHITPMAECGTCHGSGLKQGAKRAECKSCGGTGQRVTSMGGFHMSATCSSCGGSGFAIPRGSSCGTCGGDGAVKERKTITIDIPGGVEDGMRLRVNGEGDAPLTGQAMSSGQIRGQTAARDVREPTNPVTQLPVVAVDGEGPSQIQHVRCVDSGGFQELLAERPAEL